MNFRMNFLLVLTSFVCINFFAICEAMSMATLNGAGMFWYGIGLILSGVVFNVCFEKL